MSSDLYRRVFTLRTELWQLADAGHLSAPPGVDLEMVLRQVDHHLQSAEGLLRPPAGTIREMRTADGAHAHRHGGHHVHCAHCCGAHSAPEVHAHQRTADPMRTLAEDVVRTGKSKQPVEVLIQIFEADARRVRPTRIAEQLRLPHSTVIRAIQAGREIGAGSGNQTSSLSLDPRWLSEAETIAGRRDVRQVALVLQLKAAQDDLSHRDIAEIVSRDVVRTAPSTVTRILAMARKAVT